MVRAMIGFVRFTVFTPSTGIVSDDGLSLGIFEDHPQHLVP